MAVYNWGFSRIHNELLDGHYLASLVEHPNARPLLVLAIIELTAIIVATKHALIFN
jgi:hypothetical protein